MQDRTDEPTAKMGCAVITLFAPHKRIVDPSVRLPAIAFAANFNEIPQAADGPTTGHHGAGLIDDTNFVAVVDRSNDRAVRLGPNVCRKSVAGPCQIG